MASNKSTRTDNDTTNLLVSERKEAIGRLIEENNVVSIKQLSQMYSISKVTVHRILDELQDEGKIEKIRGGAKTPTAPRPERRFQIRMQTDTEEKRLIASKAVRLVRNRDTIFIDSSTTTLYFARELTRIRDLQVVIITNSPMVVYELGSCANMRIIATGGELQHDLNAMVGPIAIDVLKKLSISSAFISCAAVSAERGLMTGATMLADLVQTVISNSTEVNLLAVSEKFTKVAPLKVASVTDIDRVVTDQRIDRSTRASLEELDIEVL